MGLDRHARCHVISCSTWLKEDAKYYVQGYFKKERCMKGSEGSITPCTKKRHWLEKNKKKPSLLKDKASKSSKNGRKDPHEDPNKLGKLAMHEKKMVCNTCH